MVWSKKWKSGRIENREEIEKYRKKKKNLVSLIFVWLGVKNWKNEKTSLYKFTHMPLLKNDVQFKKKKNYSYTKIKLVSDALDLQISLLLSLVSTKICSPPLLQPLMHHHSTQSTILSLKIWTPNYLKNSWLGKLQ